MIVLMTKMDIGKSKTQETVPQTTTYVVFLPGVNGTNDYWRATAPLTEKIHETLNIQNTRTRKQSWRKSALRKPNRVSITNVVLHISWADNKRTITRESLVKLKSWVLGRSWHKETCNYP